MDSGAVTSWQLVWIVALMQGTTILVVLVCGWVMAHTCWKAQKLHAEAENRLLAVSEKLLMANMAAGPIAQQHLAGRALEENRSGVTLQAPIPPTGMRGLPPDPEGVYVGAGD